MLRLLSCTCTWAQAYNVYKRSKRFKFLQAIIGCRFPWLHFFPVPLTRKYETTFNSMWHWLVYTHLRHQQILTLSYKAPFRLHNSLQELQILHMTTVGLYASNEMLDNSFGNFIAKLDIIMENSSCCFSLKQLTHRQRIIK